MLSSYTGSMFTVKEAFRTHASTAVAPTKKKAAVRKDDLEVVFKVNVGAGLCCLATSPSGLLAAATAEGVVLLIDGVSGSTRARSEEMEEPPNAMTFTSDSQFLISCADDGCARVLAAASAKVLIEHSVAEEPVDGKRPRCYAADHVVALDGAFVAAAGRLLHGCGVPDGQLEHEILADSPIRALSVASPGTVSWAYAAAHKGGVLLVDRRGDVARKLTSDRPLKSLAVTAAWLAASAFDGVLELWDISGVVGQSGEANHRLQTYCGSDGEVIHFSVDGGGLAMSGARAAVIDFTGSNPPHPYRKGAGAPGQPDPLPRVCMDDNHVQYAAWAPHLERGDKTTLATVGKDGAVRTWQPRGLPLRKGGKGDPSRPQQMNPQLYTFLKHDAAHPSGDALPACTLVWLGEDVVAVGYSAGDIVAWRLID